MNPIRVVLVSTQRRWHGGEVQAQLLAAGLRARGHRVDVLARRGGEFDWRMAADGFPVHTFAGRGRGPLAIWQLRGLLRRLQPDLLYMNDGHSLSVGALAAAGLPIPARIAARRVDFPIRSARWYERACDRVICVSQAVADVCRAGGMLGRKLRVVHDGVDPARMLAGSRERGRASLELDDACSLLLTVAKLTDHKGHRFLLDAMPAVLERHPNLCLALAGGGELRDALVRQSERLGIGQHVRFLGYRSDVPDLIKAADLFVMPSHMEGLCSSLADVMLAERPIVTTTAGGIPDLVGTQSALEEPVAWTVPPCNPPALAAAISAALEQPQRAAALALRARQRAEQRFTAGEMVEGTLAVYRDILADRQRRAA